VSLPESPRSLPRSPTLDALAADPHLAAGLPLATLVDLRRRSAQVVAELDARIALAMAPAAPPPCVTGSSPDGRLRPTEAAELLGVTPRWLRQHAVELAAFTYRLNSKTVRYSAAGLKRWIAAKKA